MENKYKEIMNRVQIDEAMRSRILDAINEEAANHGKKPVTAVTPIPVVSGSDAKNKARRRAMITRMIPAIAAAAILLIGGIVIFGNLKDKDEDLSVKSEDTEGARDVHNSYDGEAVSYNNGQTGRDGVAEATEACEDEMSLEVDGQYYASSTLTEMEGYAYETTISQMWASEDGFTYIVYYEGEDRYLCQDGSVINDLLVFAEYYTSNPDSIVEEDVDISYLFVLGGGESCDEMSIAFGEGFVVIDGNPYESPAAMEFAASIASRIVEGNNG